MIEVGQKVSHFRIHGKVGEGGMGEVFRAEDTRLRRAVALKFLPEDMSGDARARARFVDEAQAASALDHPNICVIHEIDQEPGGRFFIAMAFYEGRTLGEWPRGATTPVAEALRILCQVASGLGAAHEAGIVHRDIKPSNLMLTDSGVVKILDFGLAKLLKQSSRTATGAVIGTVSYMSPEQIRGEDADARSDIFSLGVVFYELLTGRSPFRGDTPASLVHSVLEHEPPLPSRIRPELDPRLDRLVLRMLAKKRKSRFQSVASLLAELEEFEECAVSDTRTITAPRTLVARPRRASGRSLALWTSVAVAILAGLLAWHWLRPPPSPAQREWLLISDFENSTGLSVFDKTLTEALVLAIDQSRFVNVMSRARLFDALGRMKRGDADFIDEQLGMEICRREGVPVLLAGSVRRVGETFRITVRALSVQNGDLLFSATEDFSRQDELFARADALADRVRRWLGEEPRPLAEHSLPLERATTSSLEALQLSTQARDLILRGKLEEATQLLQGALERDPDFATAHMRLASAQKMLGRAEAAAEHFESAFALREGVSERERYLIEGKFFSHQERYEKSVESFRVLVGLYPDDLEAHHGLALAYGAMGRLHDAIRELREVLRLDPFDRHAYGNLMLFLAQTNANAEVAAVYERARDHDIDSPYLLWGLGLAALGEGQSEAARRHFDSLADEGGAFEALGSFYRARAEIFEGNLTAAEERLRRDVRNDELGGNYQYLGLRRQLLAELHHLRGDTEAARRELELLLALGPELQVDQLRAAGSLYARLGDLPRAAAVLAEIEALAESSPAVYFAHCLHFLRGEMALAEGRPAEALWEFEAADRVYPRFRTLVGSARAHVALEQWEEAASSWQRVLGEKGQILRSGFPAVYAVAHVELARALRALGRSAEAAARCGDLDSLWAEPESLPRQGEVCPRGAGESEEPVVTPTGGPS